MDWLIEQNRLIGLNKLTGLNGYNPSALINPSTTQPINHHVGAMPHALCAFFHPRHSIYFWPPRRNRLRPREIRATEISRGKHSTGQADAHGQRSSKLKAERKDSPQRRGVRRDKKLAESSKVKAIGGSKLKENMRVAH